MEEDTAEQLATRTVRDMGRILSRMIADGEYIALLTPSTVYTTIDSLPLLSVAASLKFV